MAKGGFRGMPGGMNQAAMMKQAQKLQRLAVAWSLLPSTASMNW